MRGLISKLISERGFGFIEGEDGRGFFFQLSSLRGIEFEELAPGVSVEFEVREHAHGDQPGEDPRAVGVHLTDDAIPAVDNEILLQGKVNP